jgi:hypothetical protein
VFERWCALNTWTHLLESTVSYLCRYAPYPTAWRCAQVMPVHASARSLRASNTACAHDKWPHQHTRCITVTAPHPDWLFYGVLNAGSRGQHTGVSTHRPVDASKGDELEIVNAQAACTLYIPFVKCQAASRTQQEVRVPMANRAPFCAHGAASDT